MRTTKWRREGGGSEFVARSEIINLIRRRSRLPFSYLLLTIEVRRRREERETKTKEKCYFHSNATLLISGVSFGAHLYIVYSQVLGQCTHARSEQKNRKYSIAEGSFLLPANGVDGATASARPMARGVDVVASPTEMLSFIMHPSCPFEACV